MDLPLQINANSQPVRVWDWAVPIVRNDNSTKVYLTDQISSPDYYNEACDLLDNAKEHETVYLVLNTPGGNADSAFMLADAIKRTKAKTVARLSGTVASAGTIITMACDEIEAAEGLGFMIHSYSASYSGKANELKSLQKFADAEVTNHFRNVYSGFLTEEELDKIVEGNDHWMGTNEVVTRWIDRNKPKKAKKGE